MKWKTRSDYYSLMAGLIILTSSCSTDSYKLQLLSSKLLTDFPSASAIEFHNEKLYILGDDAAHLLVLDTQYNPIKKVRYLPDTSYRISKKDKPDIEAATILTLGEQNFLYAFGSMSASNRKYVYSFSLDSLENFTRSSYKLKFSNIIKEWNIEGATFVNDQLLLSNRANNTNRMNYLVIETFSTGGKVANSIAKVVALQLPENGVVTGVSGLYYVPQNDVLLFTASEENTPNAMQDGAIGNSYLGWIKNFSVKMFRNKVQPDELVKLTKVNKAFNMQKIESVCLEKITGKKMILHLAADNDNGQSTLFKVQLSL